MKRSFALLLLTLGFLAAVTDGHPAAAEATPWHYRYLFIVDGSREMENYRADIAGYLAEMIRSGAGGWMGRGDILGFWTIDDRIHRDALPVEFWTIPQRERIASQIGLFIMQHRFQRGSGLELPMGDLKRGIEKADSLTMVLIYDASRPVRGTPFDDRIRDASQALLKERGVPHLAVVTRLTVLKGILNGWNVDILPSHVKEEPPVPQKAAAVIPPPEPVKPPSTTVAPAPVAASKPAVIPEKPLPPPPAIPKELVAPLKVEPLRYKDGDELPDSKKAGLPVVVSIPPDPPSKAIANAASTVKPVALDKAPSAPPDAAPPVQKTTAVLPEKPRLPDPVRLAVEKAPAAEASHPVQPVVVVKPTTPTTTQGVVERPALPPVAKPLPQSNAAAPVAGTAVSNAPVAVLVAPAANGVGYFILSFLIPVAVAVGIVVYINRRRAVRSGRTSLISRSMGSKE
jgi:hypothetical protein